MGTFTVKETIRINAEPVNILDVLADFQQWEPWSPWLSAEPGCKLSYREDGQAYSWNGDIIGSGEMEIQTRQDTAIHYQLHFLKPWKSESKVAFNVDQNDGGCDVTWSMEGSMPFFLFFMKKMMRAWIGMDYRRGLAKLKDYIESGSVPSKIDFAGIGQGLSTKYVGVRYTCGIDEVSEHAKRAFTKLHEWIEKDSIESAGAPFSIDHTFRISKGICEMTAAVPVESIPLSLPEGFSSGTHDVPKTYKLVHTGAYRHLGSAWSAGMMHMRAKRFRKNKRSSDFEVYLNEPMSTPESELITEVHFAVN